MNQYDPPPNYGIPNPLGPRLHNWRGGRYNEGSLFHGPVYTRPSYNLPRITRPVFGTPEAEEESEKEYLLKLGVISVLMFIGLSYTFDTLEGKHWF